MTLADLRGVPVREPVVEIDFPEDLRRAREEILPGILGRELQLLL